MADLTYKARIAKLIWEQKETSKQDILKRLNISMPTVLQNVSELIHTGVLLEAGEYKSTGGRKAKAIVLNGDYKYAAGINITQNHMSCVIINMRGEIIHQRRVTLPFCDHNKYYEELREILDEMLKDKKLDGSRILGVGFSLPGILDSAHSILIRSRALGVENLDLDLIRNLFDYPVAFENDANSALLSEIKGDIRNAFYFSLNNTVGGAFCVNGKIYMGENSRGGEIGHTILKKDGKMCCCGKKGCFNAYCSAQVLTEHTDGNLPLFFEEMEKGDSKLAAIWNEYLEYLAVAVTNVRMLCDCSVILGGSVGVYMDKYLHVLARKVKQYNTFDQNAAYIKICSGKTEASALGIAENFVKDFLEKL